MDLAQKPVYKLELSAGTSVVNLTTPLVEGDDRAQTFTLELTDKGSPANLNGYSVTAYFGRGKTAEEEADTIPVSGSVSDNVATITLTESCYSRSCYFSMPIRLTNGSTGQKRTYLIVRGTVVKSVDGKIIDPDGSVPSLDDLFAQITVMERTRQAAEEATEAAQTATAEAQQAAADTLAAAQTLSAVTAPAIIPTATGDGIVTISDSANRPLAGLRLYGKTTQDGVATPFAPVPLESVGAGGSIGAYARGKNLLPNTVSTTVNNGITFTSNADGTIAADGTSMVDYDAYCIVGTATLSVGEKYILTGCPSGGGFGIGLDGTGIYDWGNGIEFTAETANYTAVLIVSKNKTISDIVFSPMIRHVSDTNATFEPYKDGGSLTASTPNGLPGIPVSSGGNYTDADGKMWRSDVRDYGQGVDVQNVVTERVLPGTLGIQDNYGFFIDLPVKADTDMVLCNRATHKGIWDLSGGMTYIPGIKRVVFAKEWFGVSTLAEFNAYLDTNELTIMYALDTPIETPIPASELAAYRAMTSQYPNTTVYNDAGAGMAVDYIADTETWCTKKFTAIAEALLNK